MSPALGFAEVVDLKPWQRISPVTVAIDINRSRNVGVKRTLAGVHSNQRALDPPWKINDPAESKAMTGIGPQWDVVFEQRIKVLACCEPGKA